MKNTYASVLTCTAMLLAGTSMAQIGSKGPHQPGNGPQTIHPCSGASDLRGGGAPYNDDCSGAINQDLAIGSSVTFTGDNTNATDGGFVIAQVWETFTTTECSNLTLDYCGTTPAFGNANIALFQGCPYTSYIQTNDYDQTTCADGNFTLRFESLPAGSYYYPVIRDPEGNAVGPYTITVSAAACYAPPANDECAGAIPLTSAANCDQTYFNTMGAAQSMDPVECNGAVSTFAVDVWFSFVCTSTEQSIGVVGFNGSDAVIELFSGTCGDLTSLACADATYPTLEDPSSTEVLDQTGLTVGTTYYFRVYDFGTASGQSTFAGCVTEGSGNNIGISEQQKAIALSIYPNPGTGNFNLKYVGASGLGTIDVLDLTGRTVHSETSRLISGTTHTMDLSQLAQGQYSLRLTVNGNRGQQSLMVR